jgi:hypothetical protein
MTRPTQARSVSHRMPAAQSTHVADDMPAVCITCWPAKPTRVSPAKLGQAVADACRILANSSVERAARRRRTFGATGLEIAAIARVRRLSTDSVPSVGVLAMPDRLAKADRARPA